MNPRKCPKCSQKSLTVPLLGTTFICMQCMSRFKVGGFLRALFMSIYSTLSIALFLVVMNMTTQHWLVIFLIVVGYFLADAVFKLIAPLQQVNVRFNR